MRTRGLQRFRFGEWGDHVQLFKRSSQPIPNHGSCSEAEYNSLFESSETFASSSPHLFVLGAIANHPMILNGTSPGNISGPFSLNVATIFFVRGLEACLVSPTVPPPLHWTLLGSMVTGGMNFAVSWDASVRTFSLFWLSLIISLQYPLAFAARDRFEVHSSLAILSHSHLSGKTEM